MRNRSVNGSSNEVAGTAYGEVEYETVTCASCGNAVLKDDAKTFVIGTVKDVIDWRTFGKREYEFDCRDYQEGWACEYCRNDGIVDFPLKSLSHPTVVRLLLAAAVFAFSIGIVVGGAMF